MKTLFLLVGIIAFLYSGFSYAQQSEKPGDITANENDQPVDVTGKAHYQPGSRGYMAGKEHYIQGNPNYMAGKEHYLPQPSSSTLQALAEQFSADAISAKVEEEPTMVLQITIEEGEEEEQGLYQIPAFRGDKLAPPREKWLFPAYKEERSRGKSSRRDRDSSQPIMSGPPPAPPGPRILHGVLGGAYDQYGNFYPESGDVYLDPKGGIIPKTR